MSFGKVDRMRKDYGPGSKGGFESSTTAGSKGIPPGAPGSSDPKATKGVCSPTTEGNKGVIPMGQNPTAKAPRD